MDLVHAIRGWVRIRHRSADISSLLTQFEKNRIAVYDAVTLDELTLEYSVSTGDLPRLRHLIDKRGEHWSVSRRKGLLWPLKALRKRIVLVIGLMMLLSFGMLLPGRILFVSVEGNHFVPQRRILEAAGEAGLKFGSVRRDIRSEQIKNQLLDAVPELKWAGVNTYGSRAVITVRERDDRDEEGKPIGIRHIIAKRDGVITSATVTSGCGVCSVGQAVKQGDVLISGYTDCGLLIRADAAQGIIFAETTWNLRVLTPDSWRKRTGESAYQVHYSLVLGKKRINFYKGSGISGATCVKMSTEYVLTLPGGFTLPVSLQKDQIIDCSLIRDDIPQPQDYLEQFASDYLDGQMVSGTVIQKEEAVQQSDSVWILDGQYACIENIGLEQDEKIGDFHGKTDGTDRERRQGG